MIAFHGSPCLFDRFDAAKIGVPARPLWPVKPGGVVGSEGWGIYLTNDRQYAATYAVQRWRYEIAPVSQGGGYVYDVQAPDGVYIDNARLCSEQPEPARTILLEAISRFDDLQLRQKRWLKYRIDNATGQNHYSQIGVLLRAYRMAGSPLEPNLIAAGHVGCKRRWDEETTVFTVFDPDRLQILSASPLLPSQMMEAA